MLTNIIFACLLQQQVVPEERAEYVLRLRHFVILRGGEPDEALGRLFRARDEGEFRELARGAGFGILEDRVAGSLVLYSRRAYPVDLGRERLGILRRVVNQVVENGGVVPLSDAARLNDGMPQHIERHMGQGVEEIESGQALIAMRGVYELRDAEGRTKRVSLGGLSGEEMDRLRIRRQVDGSEFGGGMAIADEGRGDSPAWNGTVEIMGLTGRLSEVETAEVAVRAQVELLEQMRELSEEFDREIEGLKGVMGTKGPPEGLRIDGRLSEQPEGIRDDLGQMLGTPGRPVQLDDWRVTGFREEPAIWVVYGMRDGPGKRSSIAAGFPLSNPFRR